MRIRRDEVANYRAVFLDNGRTLRFRLNAAKPFGTPRTPEIEDVAINSKCLANCFVPGTLVRTMSGCVPIENIQIGDVVISWNEKEYNFTKTKKVYHLFKNPYKGKLVRIELADGATIDCTPNHKFLCFRGWVAAEDLDVEDAFVSLLSCSHIKNISREYYEGFVYNFSVEDDHNYSITTAGIIVSNCHYCYTSATAQGENFRNIVGKAHEIWGMGPVEDRPFQIAIGGAGESTLHPDWVEFVSTVRKLGIVPNYTTNGMHLTEAVLSATEQYCGGVALSWHPHIHKTFVKAAAQLSSIKTRLNFHIILGSLQSFQDMISLYETYKDRVEYFVILPYQAAGRGVPMEVNAVWQRAFEWIASVDSKKFAFGALFYDFLLKNNVPLKMALYEPERFSGYRMMDSSFRTLRKSSYDLRPKTPMVQELTVGATQCSKIQTIKQPSMPIFS